MKNEEIFVPKAAALKYDRKKDNSPKVVAKGRGEIAKTIIKIAEDNDLPIKRDADMVELLSKLELEQEIPTEMYKAVAEIFAFIYQITNEKRKENEEKY